MIARSNAYLLNWRNLRFPLVSSGFLVAVSFHNFLLFHTTAELFSICVAVLMCVVAWQTYPFSKNNFLMYLACGFFWVGSMDLVHTLAYKGMNIFPITDANPATQFWIATRYLQAFVMLTAPYFLTHTVGRNRTFFAFGAIAVALNVLIMSGNFPDAFIEGQGLTAFKINSEYVIIAILAGALAWLFKRRAIVEPRVFTLLVFSILLTMGSELAFTFYVSVYGISNLVGHIFKIFAFWMIYEAVIHQSLREPYLELERRVVERTKELKLTSEGLANAQHLAHIGSWYWDIASGEVLWSDEAFRIFGHEPGAFTSSYEKLIEAVHPEDRDVVGAAVAKGLESGKPYAIEHKVLLPDGEVRYVAEQGEATFNDVGAPISMHGTVQDITERMLVENNLRQLSRAVEQVPNTIFITNLDGTIEYVNSRFTEMTGYSEEEAIGSNPRILQSGDTPRETYADLWNTIKTGKEWRGEIKDRRKDGTHFWAYETVGPIRDKNGIITHYVAIHEDITQRKKIELLMKKATEQAKIANRAKSELLANMSHELRTPLNAIIGFTGAIKAETFGPIGNEKYDEYIDDIGSSGQHLLELINDILDVSAIEAGKLELHENNLVIEDLVEASVRLIKDRAERKNINLNVNIANSLPMLYADVRRMKQILLNLLSNAVKFTPDNGVVTLSVTCDETSGHVFTITDNGIGMDHVDLAKAMAEFGQADSGLDRKEEGTGLGLPLTKGLVELHGGTFDITSEKGKGTTVTVCLPKERAEVGD